MVNQADKKAEEQIEGKDESQVEGAAVDTSNMQWYAIHTFSGHEEKVKDHLERNRIYKNLEDKVAQIIIPTEEVLEVKKGKKTIISKKLFSGYILMQMEITDEVWYLIKNTQGVSGFVGPGGKPAALKPSEVKSLLARMTDVKSKPRREIPYSKGEMVTVTSGPFASFNGRVEDIDEEKGRLKVMVSIFGRATPVDLDYVQVEKMQ